MKNPFRNDLALLCLASLLATTLALSFLGKKSLDLDEVFSVVIAHDWEGMWQLITNEELNMWLYYALLHYWLKLGNGEFWVRSLSALFAVATVPAAYLLGKRLFGSRVATLAGLLLAVNPFLILHAQNARSYSLFLFLVILSSYFFVNSIEKPRGHQWIAYVVTSTLAVYAHLFASLVVVAQLISLLFRGKQRVP